MRASVLVLVAVAASTRFVAPATLAAAFLVILVLLALAFFLLVEASGHFFEPAVRDLVGAVHDATQDEFLHDGLVVGVAWRRPGEELEMEFCESVFAVFVFFVSLWLCGGLAAG
jgi:hypothetical protein